MADATITHYYPGGWQDLQSGATPLWHSPLQRMEDNDDAILAQANLALATALAAGGGAISALAGTVSLAQMAPGASFNVYKVGAAWKFPGPTGATITTRPTARTDLTMESFSTDGTVPSFAISGLDIANTVPA